MREIWKDIPDYEGLYQVSNLGRVKSLERYVKHLSGSMKLLKERILVIIKNGGYYRVTLSKNNIKKAKTIHRLIGESFIPNPNNLPFINHIDGNKLNNSVENLEWCTSQENCIHAVYTGLMSSQSGEKNPSSKLDEKQVREIRNLHKKGTSYKELSILYGISKEHASAIVRKIYWREV